jgi:hypothetical protein
MREQGIALMELMLVVGLAAVVTTAAWVAWGSTSAGATIEQESEHLVALDQAIQADYLVAQDRYQSITTQDVATRSLAPEAWIQGSRLVSPELGDVALSPINGGQGFRITLGAVPANVCQGLVMKNHKLFSAVHVRGRLVYEHRAINEANLADGCSESGEVAFDHF